MKQVFRSVLIGIVALTGVMSAAAVAQAQTSPASSAPTQSTSGKVAVPPSVAASLAAATKHLAAVTPYDSARHICYSAHVQDIGWQPTVCDGTVAGTTGQGLRIEALAIETENVGGFCAQAHVQNIGWQAPVCQPDGIVATVGTTGEGLRMEALIIGVSSGQVCADAHVQDIGWQGTVCATSPARAQVGTTGQGLRMEAITMTAPA